MPPIALAGLPVALAGHSVGLMHGAAPARGKTMKIAIAILIVLQVANLAATLGTDHLNRRRAMAVRCLLYAAHNMAEPKACTEAFPENREP